MVSGYVRVPGIAKTRGRNANTQCFICKLRGTFSTSHFSEFISDLRQFSLGTPISSTNKTDRRDIAEILLKVALNTINQPILQKVKKNSIFLYL